MTPRLKLTIFLADVDVLSEGEKALALSTMEEGGVVTVVDPSVGRLALKLDTVDAFTQIDVDGHVSCAAVHLGPNDLREFNTVAERDLFIDDYNQKVSPEAAIRFNRVAIEPSPDVLDGYAELLPRAKT